MLSESLCIIQEFQLKKSEFNNSLQAWRKVPENEGGIIILTQHGENL